MAKAVLLLDMPENCSECQFLDDINDYPMCILTNEVRGYDFHTRARRMDKCPMMPVSTKEDLCIDGLLNIIAEKVDDKMTYMCGCRNCIEKVKMIIKGDVRPIDIQCDICETHRDCSQNRKD
jgi:hypothetical protein